MVFFYRLTFELKPSHNCSVRCLFLFYNAIRLLGRSKEMWYFNELCNFKETIQLQGINFIYYCIWCVLGTDKPCNQHDLN